MNRLTAAVLLAMLSLLATSTADVCLAADPAQGTIAPGTGIVLSLENTSFLGQAALRQTAAKYGLDEAPPPILMDATDPRFLSPFLKRLQATREATSRDCSGQTQRFSELLEKASQQLNFLDDKKAQGLLERAVLALPCETEVPSSAVVARYFFLEGLLYIQRGMTGTRQFQHALSIDPSLRAPTQYSSVVQQQFAAARKTVPDELPVAILLELDLGGLELWIDGKNASKEIPTLLPGAHFLLMTRDGKVTAGAVITLARPKAGTSIVWPPADLRALTPADAISRLQRAVMSGNPDAVLASALEDFLKTGKHPWLLLVKKPNKEGEARVLIVKSGQAAQSSVVRAPVRMGEARTVAFGAFAVVGGATYGVALFRAYNAPRMTPEENRINKAVGNAGMVVGLLGATGMAVVTWLGRPDSGPAKQASGPHPIIRVSPSGTGLAMNLEITW